MPPRPGRIAEEARPPPPGVSARAHALPPRHPPSRRLPDLKPGSLKPAAPARPGRIAPRLLQDTEAPEGLPGSLPTSSSFRPSYPTRVLSGTVLTSPVSAPERGSPRYPTAPSGGSSREVQTHVVQAAADGAGKTPDLRSVGLSVRTDAVSRGDPGTSSSSWLFSASQPARRAPARVRGPPTG